MSEKLPPGPKGLPYLGSLIDYFKDILRFLTTTANEYGDIVFFKLGPRNVYLISDPELIRQVLITDSKNFTKSRALNRSKIVVGEGLLTNEGEKHLANRRVIQPLFHKKAIPNYVDAVISHTEKMCRRWQNGMIVDINREMMHLTQNIVVDALFNSAVERNSGLLVDSLTTIMNSFPRMLFPYSEYLDNLPLPHNYRFKKALRNLDGIVYSIIEEKRSSGNEGHDLVSLLVGAKDEEGKDFFTNRQIRDEVITFFIAGQETTANALSWTWHLIANNKYVEKKIEDELSGVLNHGLPSYDDIDRLVYLNNVIKESLRLYPPAWAVVRKSINEYNIAGYNIPPGSDIYMSQYVVHRDSRFFEEPTKFYPERWESLDSSNLPRFAYFPFGGGTRKCIGEPFALMEAVLILAVVFDKWRMEPVYNSEIKPKPLITIRPGSCIEMKLQRP